MPGIDHVHDPHPQHVWYTDVGDGQLDGEPHGWFGELSRAFAAASLADRDLYAVMQVRAMYLDDPPPL